jgi:hypothetical protein
MKLPRWLTRDHAGETHQPDAAHALSKAWPETAKPSGSAAIRTLMFTAQEIAKANPAALTDLIAAILRPEQSELILGVAEHGQDAKADVHGYNFFCDDFREFFPEGRRKPVEKPQVDYPLTLGRDPLLPCPWHDSRFIAAMSYIGAGKLDQAEAERKRYGGPWRQDGNHRVVLWLPWRIGFVAGGNHSLAAGILAGEGSVVPDRVEDFSCLFELMECDGIEFRDRLTNAHLAPVTNIRHAAVFEIGRMIVASRCARSPSA